MNKFQVGRTNLSEPHQVKPDEYAFFFFFFFGGGGCWFGSLRSSQQLWSWRDGHFT